jgi:hypothetical protein
MASSFRVNFPLGCLRNYEKISSVPEWLDFKCVGPADFISQDENNFVREGQRHVWAPKLYFMSFQDSPPRVRLKNELSPRKQVVRSAATSDQISRELMNKAAVHVQVEGKKTPSTADDIFEEFKIP